MRSTVAFRALGTPSKHEALLFGKTVTAQPPIHPSTEALHDYLEENGVLQRYQVPFESQVFRSDAKEEGQRTWGAGSALYTVLRAQHKFQGDRAAYEEYFLRLQESYRANRHPSEWHHVLYAHKLIERLADTTSEIQNLNDIDKLILDRGTRLLCTFIPEKDYPSIVGVLAEGFGPDANANQPNLRSQRVYEAVLTRLPVPSEGIPWEQIIEYRREKEVGERFLALHRWMDKAVRSDIPLPELHDELDHLINEYEAHMRVARMEFRHGTLRAFITLSLQIGEAIVAQDWSRIKWKDMLNFPFQIKEHRIALEKAELSAPGRDVSYIIQSRHSFNQ